MPIANSNAAALCGGVNASTSVILGEPSWLLASDIVRIAVTHRGTHMAPVQFQVSADNVAKPYYISPWQVCLPFGRGDFSETEQHPSQGETSGGLWTLQSVSSAASVHPLHIAMETTARPVRIEREFHIADGHTAVYDTTTIHAFAGPATMAHRAVLRAPRTGCKPLLLSTGAFDLGGVYPQAFADPTSGSYQILKPGARFTSLAAVPSIFGGGE